MCLVSLQIENTAVEKGEYVKEKMYNYKCTKTVYYIYVSPQAGQ